MIKSKYTSAITDYKNRWWDIGPGCIAAYQPKGVSSKGESYINLANPGTYTLIENSAPTQNYLDGWVFTADALQTGISVKANIGWTIIVRCSDIGSLSSSKCIVGGQSAKSGTGIFIIPRSNEDKIIYKHNVNGGEKTGSTCTSSAVLAVTKNGGYLNGNLDSDAMGDCDFSINQLYNIAIGSSYWGEVEYSVSRVATAKIQAIAFYNTTLTATQIKELTAVMNAL